MKLRFYIMLSTVMFVGCQEQPKQQVNADHYRVQTAQELQQRFNHLNNKLTSDFTQFKKVESNAFAHQYPFDANNLQSLNQHLLASTALKSTKVAYCDMMNHYFAEMFRLGHYNLNLVDAIELPNAKAEDLKVSFNNADQFYDFILNRYTTYRQVQQTMNYGCNLKAALTV